jgi:Uncharacterised nucleotidyltransferase
MRGQMTVDPDPPPAVLPLPVQLEFVHGLVDLVASRSGCRVLHIKGPVAAGQLGLAGRQSGDVDVWVTPDHRAHLIRTLEEVGWTPLDQGRSIKLIEHATVLTHPSWGCAIDLHHRFPGMGIEPQGAFDLLWSAREQVTIAGHDLAAPSLSAHALLILLHAARGRGEPRALEDVRHVTSMIAPSMVGELVAWAKLLACEPALAAVVPAWSDKGDGPEYLHWRVRAGEQGASGVQVWLTRMLASPGVGRKAALLRGAILPDRVVMVRRAGRSLTTPGLVWAWLRRWGKGAVATPRALVQLSRPPLTESRVASAAPLADEQAIRHAPATGSAAVPTALAWSEAEGLTWLADLLPLRVFVLTPTAALAWRVAAHQMSADGQVSVPAVVEAVEDAVRGQPALLQDDVLRAVETLSELGLLGS